MNEFFSNVEIGKAFLTLAQNPEAIRKSNRLNRIQKNSSKTTKKHYKYGAKSNNELKKKLQFNHRQRLNTEEASKNKE